MQNCFSCYLKIIYLNLEWIVDLCPLVVVQDFIDLLNQQFECDIKGEYLLEIKSNRVLNNKETFVQNKLKSGDYLYFI